MTSEERISVIVPCYNDERIIAECLQSLIEQRKPVHEIIVIDDQSTDASPQVIQNFPVKYLRTPRRAGAGAARNMGVEAATGDILAFLDSDCLAPDTWSIKLSEIFAKDPQLGGVGGRYTHRPMRTLQGKLAACEEAFLFSVYAQNPEHISPCGGISAFRKAAWVRGRSWKEQIYFRGMGSGEDSVIGSEIKKLSRVTYCHDWTVLHASKDRGGYFRRHFNRGFSRSLIIAKELTDSNESRVVFQGHGGWPLLLATVFLPFSLAWMFAPTSIFWFLFSALALGLHFGLSHDFFRFIRSQEKSWVTRGQLRILLGVRTLLWALGSVKGLIFLGRQKIHQILNTVCSILHFWRPGRISKLFFFVTSRCNARCGFCFNIDNVNNWQKRKPSELSLGEIQKIAMHLGRLPYLTLSGGEPFLRTDLPEVIESFYVHAQTQWVTIPTNAALTEKVRLDVGKILSRCPRLFLTIQISVDDLFERHDRSRQIKDGFAKLSKTLSELALMKGYFPNLRVQIATMYDHTNLDQIQKITKYCQENFSYDQQIFYLVRSPGDLRNSANTELVKGYLKFLKETESWEFRNRHAGLWARAVRVLQRLVYQDLQKIKLDGSYTRTCFATQKFVTLWDDGKISPCEVLEGQSLGSIRDFEYNFYRLKKEMNLNRFHQKEIVQRQCTCDWICAPPINMLYDPRTVRDVVSGFLFPHKFNEM